MQLSNCEIMSFIEALVLARDYRCYWAKPLVTAASSGSWCVYVCVRVRACVRACMRACVCVCVHVCGVIFIGQLDDNWV